MRHFTAHHRSADGLGRFAWAVSLGVVLAGWLTAHCLGYWIVERDVDHRHHGLEATGHGYFDLKPILTLAATLVVIGLVGRVLLGARRTPATSAPPTPVFLLAPLGFLVQEHLERALHLGEIPYGTVLEPSVLLGFILQAPFAVLAFHVARALLASADALSLRLGGGSAWAQAADPGLPLVGPAQPAPRIAPRSLGGGPRAPPDALAHQM